MRSAIRADRLLPGRSCTTAQLSDISRPGDTFSVMHHRQHLLGPRGASRCGWLQPAAARRASLSTHAHVPSAVNDSAVDVHEDRATTTDAPAQTGQPAVVEQHWDWKYSSRIRYYQAGSTGPPLLLVHGFGVGAYHYERNIPFLAQHFRVWSVDLLGQGEALTLSKQWDLGHAVLHWQGCS
jgi:hypothetical protein